MIIDKPKQYYILPTLYFRSRSCMVEKTDTWNYFEVRNRQGNEIFCQFRSGYWYKREYDLRGNLIYLISSIGYWVKREYDADGKEIYYENSMGRIIDKR